MSIFPSLCSRASHPPAAALRSSPGAPVSIWVRRRLDHGVNAAATGGTMAARGQKKEKTDSVHSVRAWKPQRVNVPPGAERVLRKQHHHHHHHHRGPSPRSPRLASTATGEAAFGSWSQGPDQTRTPKIAWLETKPNSIFSAKDRL